MAETVIAGSGLDELDQESEQVSNVEGVGARATIEDDESKQSADPDSSLIDRGEPASDTCSPDTDSNAGSSEKPLLAALVVLQKQLGRYFESYGTLLVQCGGMKELFVKAMSDVGSPESQAPSDVNPSQHIGDLIANAEKASLWLEKANRLLIECTRTVKQARDVMVLGAPAGESDVEERARNYEDLEWLHNESKWLEDQTNAPIAFKLAREILFIGADTFIASIVTTAAERAMAADNRRFLEKTATTLEELKRTHTSAHQIEWVITALDAAKENVAQGTDPEEVCSRIVSNARSHPRYPINASVDDWKWGVNHWRGYGARRNGDKLSWAQVVYCVLNPSARPKPNSKAVRDAAKILADGHKRALKVSGVTKTDSKKNSKSKKKSSGKNSKKRH